MSSRIMHRAIKVPVLPTPALQWTNGIDPSERHCRKWSIRKFKFFLPVLEGMSPSGQSVSWQWFTILASPVLVFLSSIFLSLRLFFWWTSSSSSRVISYSCSVSLLQCGSFCGQQRSHLILFFSMRLQSMKMFLTSYCSTILQKLQKLLVRGPWVAITRFPQISIRFAFMQFSTLSFSCSPPKVAREGSKVMKAALRLQVNCSGFLYNLLTWYCVCVMKHSNLNSVPRQRSSLSSPKSICGISSLMCFRSSFQSCHCCEISLYISENAFKKQLLQPFSGPHHENAREGIHTNAQRWGRERKPLLYKLMPGK